MEFKQDEIAPIFESISIANISDSEIHSPIENLPSELVFTIFKYAPEAICELRLTSHALKALVDEFVRQRATIPLVHHIGIHDLYYETECTITENGQGTMRIFIDVPARVALLFELRLKCRGVNRTVRIFRRADEHWVSLGLMNSYWLDCDIPVANGRNMATWERLLESVGPSARKVDLNIRKNTELARIYGFLELLKIEEMEFNINVNLSETEANLLLETVKHHNVEWLTLRTITVSSSIFAEFLLELSTHLRSLYIRGNFSDDVKWAPLIIGMFSRKLDKLQVVNWPREILSREDADRIIAYLPFIGKKVWFKTDFSLNSVGRSNKIQGHIIHETCPIRRPNKPSKHRMLSIIHKSRLNEPSPSGY